MGAEVMGENDDLVKVCEAADGGDACPVLARLGQALQRRAAAATTSSRSS